MLHLSPEFNTMLLHYRRYGEGTPLIILHGLFGQSDNWNTIAKKLSEKNFNVYIVDLRNHGLSPHSNDMSYELMANDIKNLIDKENIHKPILIGHSMGGKVSMWFDFLFSNFLSKLIVADIAPRKYPPGHEDVFIALNSVNFNTIKTRKEAEATLRKHLNNQAVIQFLLKNLYWETPEKLNWRFNLNAIQNHYEEISKEVPAYTSNTPTLFIRGENSTYITDEDLKDIQNRYTNVKIITIPKAGHWVHAEQPQLFTEEVIKFIQH